MHHITRAAIPQEQMICIPAAEAKDGVAIVIYEAKDNKSSKTFTALDWLTQFVANIPNIPKFMVYDDFSQLTLYNDDYSQVAEEHYS